MPIYEYKGVHYDLPDGLSNNDALLKIKTHLGETSVEKSIESPSLLDRAKGALETGASLATGMFAQPIAGVAGLGKSIFSNANEGANVVRNVQEALTYAPKTETGKQYTENVGKVFNYPIEQAGEFGERVGGNEGRLVGEVASEVAMDFLPLGFIAKGVKGLKGKQGKVPTVEKELNLPKVDEPSPTIVNEKTLPDLAELSQQMKKEGKLPLERQLELDRIITERERKLADTAVQSEFDFTHDPYTQEKLSTVDENNMPINEALSRDVQRETMTERMDDGEFLQNRDLFEESKPSTDVSSRGIYDPEVLRSDKYTPEEYVQQADKYHQQVALEKQKQIEQMYTDRMSALEQEKIQSALDETNDRLTSLEEELRDSAYKPTLGGQGAKTRAFNAGMSGRQRGGLLISPRGQKTITKEQIQTATNQITTEQKQQLVASITGDKNLTERYRNDIDTPEKVLAVAPQVKDIGPLTAAKARTISGGGVNSLIASTNNPLLKLLRYNSTQIFRQAENLSREYVTGKNGFGIKLRKLSSKEREQVVETMFWQDKHQRRLSTDELRTAGLNDKQINFIQHVQEMNDVKYKLFNETRKSLGLPEVTYREGYSMGTFRGDYRTMVYDKNGHVIGFVGTHTLVGHKLALSKVKKDYPDAKFSEIRRKSLDGSGTHSSNFFTGVQDILTTLSKNDPRFAKIKDIANAVNAEEADGLFGSNLHAKDKKGIWGAEGKKFWEDKTTNTKEFLKAYVEDWESGILSHLNLPKEVEFKAVLESPELDHMPNAKKYAEDYINNMTGRSLGDTADAINKVIDNSFRLVGLGPSIPKAIINQFNKRASQFTMGLINPLFMVTQYLQIAQTGFPALAKHGVITPKVAMKPVSDAIKMALEYIEGKPQKIDELTREAYQFAQDSGLMTFSEFGQTQHVFQNKFQRGFDKTMDFTREFADKTTRPYIFFSAVELLKNKIPNHKELFDTAYNITQEAMIDYNNRERPLMYGRLGVLGQTAGSLQTFKHGFLSQLSTFIGDAGRGKPTPLILSGLGILAYSGIKGVPFYQELDELYQSITSKYFHDRKTIADSVMKNLPEWLKSGLLSTETNINMQSRVSSADVLPNSPVEAISPFTSWGTKIAKAGGEVYSNPQSSTKWKELGIAIAPSGTTKGLLETTLKTNAKGEILNDKGEVMYPRTERDTSVRKWTGGTTLDESLNKERLYIQTRNQRDRLETKKKLTEKAELLLVENKLMVNGRQSPEFKELIEAYKKEKGDPQQLVNTLIRFAKEKNLTQKQRLEGIPNDSLSSLYRYQNYNSAQ